MDRTLFLLLLSFLWIGVGCNQDPSESGTENAAHHEHLSATDSETQPAKKSLSPRTTAMANIGDAHVHIDYSAPSVRGRTIWGGLVALDQVWVTGAHKATSIDFSEDVKINGQTVPAGTYGFFTIPGKEVWTVILNKNHEQHLTDDYTESEDVMRFQVIPEELPETAEVLTYEINPTGGNKGTISVKWDKVKISFEVAAA